ncbi:MAG: S41 family peptidase [Bacilli bacterium]|nr:S41 family peptidase [Bacilli bacterium]
MAKFNYKKLKNTIKQTLANNNLMKITSIIIIVMINVILGMGLEHYIISLNNSYVTPDETLNEFIENYDYILNNYYGDIDKQALIDGAISGMVDSLGDDYSTFLGEEDETTYNVYLKGSFEGIGVKLYINEDGASIIYYVYNNSPASKAGIEAGDIILKVDNEDVTDKTTTEIGEIVKGKEGEFTLTVQRNEETLTYTLKTATVELTSVYGEVINENIGYIYIDIFASNTYGQFKELLEDLESKGIKSLIIDVRDNSGGYLSTTQNIISLFLDSSNIIYQTEDSSNTTKFYSTGNETKSYPIVLLTNGNSASGSEMLVGALKESYGALQVGETTYGKGTVQQVNTLDDGGQYKITIKKWLTPNGNWINSVGIIPDYEVSLDEEYYANPSDDTDSQLQKAIEILQNSR